MSKKDTQLQTSDFNLEKINTHEYSQILRSAIQTGSNVAVFGRRGSGKTEIAKTEIADFERDSHGKPKVKEVYINLSVAERTDMGGYPDMFGVMRKNDPSEKRQRFVDVILPQFFQHLMEGDQPCVALLDEVDKSDPSILAPLLEFIQFRSINGRRMNNLIATIMTGNLVSEGGVRPSLPLLDRAEKYLIEPSVEHWLAWAGKSNLIHPTVTAFIFDRNTELYGPVDAGENYGDASPRGWRNASRAIFDGETNKWSDDLIVKKVAGFVGKRAGLAYKIYFDHYQVLLPLVKRLFDGENVGDEYKRLEPSKQLLTCMIACSRLAGILDKAKVDDPQFQNCPKVAAHIGKFMKNSVASENILASVRTQLTLQRVLDWKLDEAKNWDKIFESINTSISTF